MLRLKVKDKVNLVLMHQMKSVQWVEYNLGHNITTITNKYSENAKSCKALVIMYIIKFIVFTFS